METVYPVNHTKLGTIWFFAAGTFAIALSFFVYKLDQYQTYNDGEAIVSNEMRDVRRAQFFVAHGTDTSDPRIGSDLSVKAANKYTASQVTPLPSEVKDSHAAEDSHDAGHYADKH